MNKIIDANNNEPVITIKARYACVDGTVYAVKPHIKYLFECQRGFLHGKNRKPEVEFYRKNKDWTADKETLHARDQKFKMLWPIRLDDSRPHDWQKRVFLTTNEIQNPNLPMVDATE